MSEYFNSNIIQKKNTFSVRFHAKKLFHSKSKAVYNSSANEVNLNTFSDLAVMENV